MFTEHPLDALSGVCVFLARAAQHASSSALQVYRKGGRVRAAARPLISSAEREGRGRRGGVRVCVSQRAALQKRPFCPSLLCRCERGDLSSLLSHATHSTAFCLARARASTANCALAVTEPRRLPAAPFCHILQPWTKSWSHAFRLLQERFVGAALLLFCDFSGGCSCVV